MEITEEEMKQDGNKSTMQARWVPQKQLKQVVASKLRRCWGAKMRLSATLANRGQAGQVKLRKEGFDPHLSRKKKKRKLEVRQNFALGLSLIHI